MALGKLIVGGGLFALIFGLFGGEAKASTPGPLPKDPKTGQDIVPDLAREAEACKYVVAARPKEYSGRKPVEGQKEDEWLTYVAFWWAYPNANPQPTGVEELAAFARLAACVSAGLKAKLPGPLQTSDITPNDGREAEACQYVVTARPKEYFGRKPAQGQAEKDWLALVAYIRAYPSGNVPPKATNELAAFARLSKCVEVGLAKPIDNPPPAPKPDDPLPIVFDTPTPGGYYRIKQGDTLFGLTSLAYGTKGGTPGNYKAAVQVNDDPFNLRFRRINQSEINLFPKGRISFYPVFGTFAQQLKDASKGAEGMGHEFAVIWFPVI